MEYSPVLYKTVTCILTMANHKEDKMLIFIMITLLTIVITLAVVLAILAYLGL